MVGGIRTVMPSIVLLTLRPTELWTLGTALASFALLFVVAVGIGWWVASATRRAERVDGPDGGS